MELPPSWECTETSSSQLLLLIGELLDEASKAVVGDLWRRRVCRTDRNSYRELHVDNLTSRFNGQFKITYRQLQDMRK